MSTIFALARRYPIVVATVVVGVVGLILLPTDAAPAVPWIVTIYVSLVAVREAWDMVRSLLRKQLGLDVLAVTAIFSTVAVGEYWASLVIVLMLAGGEALEDYAAGRAQRELNALLSRVPQQAHRLNDGDLVDVPADAVVVGDRLLVRPGEIMPVDAKLLSAGASFDESSLTGESLPAEKVQGDALLSGSVNGPIAVEVRASALARDSQYQRIVELVREASMSKAPLVRLADRYALPFTLVSLLIGGVAWIISGDPVRFAEVLVVATPCPLLIAAPVAFMAGMSSAAKAGIVIKNAGTLEKLARVQTVAFDKTGTLTHGAPEVTEVRPVAPLDEDGLLQVVGAAERYSSHVLAASLQRAATDRGLELGEATEAREVATNGVEAVIAGRRILVGKPAFIAERATGIVRPELKSGEAAVYVAVDGRFAGVVILRDRLRAEAKSTISALAAMGVRNTIMLTGDVEQTARPIAATLGITEVHAECLPEDKVRLVRGAVPRPVVMVGDGVNDAPVLAVADVGIAMGAKGSTAASESADVVILLDDLSRVARAVSIAQRTIRIAMQSILVGIAISLVLMLVATFGVLPAIVGAVLQEVVDLVTILNSLRAVKAGASMIPELRSSANPPEVSAVGVTR